LAGWAKNPMFSLRHEFPTNWHKFISSNENFSAVIKKEHFPYFAQGLNITEPVFQLFMIEDNALVPLQMTEAEIVFDKNGLVDDKKLNFQLGLLNTDREGVLEIKRDVFKDSISKDAFLMVKYGVE
jgi:hypothetical protein